MQISFKDPPPWEGNYRGNQGVVNTGLKYPSLDPVCSVMDCEGLSQQYLAVHIILWECVCMQIQLHTKETAAGGDTKARTPLSWLLFSFFSFPISSLAATAVAKERSPECSPAAPSFPFPREAGLLNLSLPLLVPGRVLTPPMAEHTSACPGTSPWEEKLNFAYQKQPRGSSAAKPPWPSHASHQEPGWFVPLPSGASHYPIAPRLALHVPQHGTNVATG